MRATPSSRVRAEPNVTPMIDVMLVLLIIFMTIGPLLDAGFPATPPRAAFSTAHPEKDADAVIGLDAAGRLYFNKVATDSAALRRLLATRFGAYPEDRIVYLRADQALPYERVQAAMALASSAGAAVIGLVSAAPPASGRR